MALASRIVSRPILEGNRVFLKPSTQNALKLLDHHSRCLPRCSSPMLVWSRRSFSSAPSHRLPPAGGGLVGGSPAGSPSTYFQRPALPANTVIRFVPQQTAWIVERMGKFSRILKPGFALLVPFLDRIAYVQSLKESAMEIPSQSAITADNVTLELDGVLYTRVFDAYKARSVIYSSQP
jgi:SPFH domain / Band 7 family